MKPTAFFTILFLVFTQFIFSQIPGPGEPTRGTSAPLDGGLLISLLAIGTFIAGFFQSKKGNKKA